MTGSAIEEVGLYPEHGTVLNRIIFCFLIQLSIYLILLKLAQSAETKSEILDKLRQFKVKEHQAVMRELQDKLNKLDLRERLLRQNRNMKI